MKRHLPILIGGLAHGQLNEVTLRPGPRQVVVLHRRPVDGVSVFTPGSLPQELPYTEELYTLHDVALFDLSCTFYAHSTLLTAAAVRAFVRYLLDRADATEPT